MVTVGYNPSTGKALWGTGGALCLGCCDDLGGYRDINYPGCSCDKWVAVNLSGITTRTIGTCYPCSVAGDPDNSHKWTGTKRDVNIPNGYSKTYGDEVGTTFLLEMTSCMTWTYQESFFTQGVRNSYVSSDCSGSPSTYNEYANLIITVTVSGSTGQLSVLAGPVSVLLGTFAISGGSPYCPKDIQFNCSNGISASCFSKLYQSTSGTGVIEFL